GPGQAGARRAAAPNPPSGIFPCTPEGPSDYVYLLTSRANPEHWTRLLKLIGREDLLDDGRFHTYEARVRHEAEINEIISTWTRQRTKQQAITQLSGASV